MEAVRVDKYDFVVCGGGVSGVAAAVSAAREGLSVALIERLGILGGTATAGGINQLLGGRKLDKNNKHVRVVGGIFDEVTDRLIEEGAAIEPDTVDLSFNPYGWYPRMASGISCDENALKICLDDICAEAGVRVYFNTVVTSAEVAGTKIRALSVFNKDGFVRIEADAFADCTGDADLAVMCGVPFDKGREEDGLTTMTSLEMHVEHVDANGLVSYQNANQSPKLVEIIDRLRESGEWDFESDIFVTVKLLEDDVFLVNVVHQKGVDGTNEAEVSRALAKGRKDCVRLFKVMQKHLPGFKNARIRKIADNLGVRETRRIRGAYTVSIEDALSGKKYEDTVASTTYNFDLPDPLKAGYDPMLGSTRNPKTDRKYVVIRIPYRSLICKEIDNIIFAGRSISVCRHVMGASRIIGPAFMTGQAAGTAAVLAKGSFSSVDTDALRALLWSRGVLTPDELPFD